MAKKLFLILLPALFCYGSFCFAQSADITGSLNSFSFKLYDQVKSGDGNIFFSAYSVSDCFGMADAGAKGKTAQEIEQAVYGGLSGDVLYQGMKNLRIMIAAPDGPDCQITVANAFWKRSGKAVRPDYLTRINNYYNGGFHELDFCKDPSGSAAFINRWVEEKTRSRIRDLVSPDSVNCYTAVILTNAVYFKGKWLDEFDKEATRDEPFYLANGTTKTIPLMSRTGNYDYAETETAQILKLPYKGNAFSMVIVLPKAKKSLADIQKDLDDVNKRLASLSRSEVEVYIPRFKLETRMELNLPLQGLGINEAFSQSADFSGIADKPLFISEVIQKAYVDVNEEGTEAAAATEINMTMSASIVPPWSIVFRADHPFLFFIRHNASGVIVFMGRFSEPK